MNTELITDFESRLGRKLPDDYRTFLSSNAESWLPEALLFDAPRSGVIDQLFTIQAILENERRKAVGIPEQSLLYIGSNVLGGCLYLKVSDAQYGEVHYMEQYRFRGLFTSFSEFLAQTHAQKEA